MRFIDSRWHEEYLIAIQFCILSSRCFSGQRESLTRAMLLVLFYKSVYADVMVCETALSLSRTAKCLLAKKVRCDLAILKDVQKLHMVLTWLLGDDIVFVKRKGIARTELSFLSISKSSLWSFCDYIFINSQMGFNYSRLGHRRRQEKNSLINLSFSCGVSITS